MTDRGLAPTEKTVYVCNFKYLRYLGNNNGNIFWLFT